MKKFFIMAKAPKQRRRSSRKFLAGFANPDILIMVALLGISFFFALPRLSQWFSAPRPPDLAFCISHPDTNPTSDEWCPVADPPNTAAGATLAKSCPDPGNYLSQPALVNENGRCLFTQQLPKFLFQGPDMLSQSLFVREDQKTITFSWNRSSWLSQIFQMLILFIMLIPAVLTGMIFYNCLAERTYFAALIPAFFFLVTLPAVFFSFHDLAITEQIQFQKEENTAHYSRSCFRIPYTNTAYANLKAVVPITDTQSGAARAYLIYADEGKLITVPLFPLAKEEIGIINLISKPFSPEWKPTPRPGG